MIAIVVCWIWLHVLLTSICCDSRGCLWHMSGEFIEITLINFDSRMVDSHVIDGHMVDSPVIDSRLVDSHMVDSHMVDRHMVFT